MRGHHAESILFENDWVWLLPAVASLRLKLSQQKMSRRMSSQSTLSLQDPASDNVQICPATSGQLRESLGQCHGHEIRRDNSKAHGWVDQTTDSFTTQQVDNLRR